MNTMWVFRALVSVSAERRTKVRNVVFLILFQWQFDPTIILFDNKFPNRHGTTVSVKRVINNQGPVSRKSRELFGPEKPFDKVRPAYSVKLVFSYVAKGTKIKITAKFRASRRLRFEDTKRIMSPEIRPKSFGTFEKQAPDP